MNEKYERYRRQVLMCKEMALKAITPGIRADWLKLAARWLEMIPLEHRSGEDAIAVIMKRDGTRQ